MFRKLVSNLPFSPALVGQLSFYAKRLRKEELTRRLGLIFTALALVVQSLAVFSPPIAANAASPADFIGGGVKGKGDFLAHYDQDTNGIKRLFDSIGITRAEIAGMSAGKVKAGEVPGKYNWSRTSLYSAAQGEKRYVVGPNLDFFSRPLSLTAGNPPYNVIEGRSAAIGWFAIKLDCANLLTTTQPDPKPDPKPDPEVVCKSLSASLIADKKYRFDVTANAKHGGNINGYAFIITLPNGSTTKVVTETSAESASAEYTASLPGDYSVATNVRSGPAASGEGNCTARFNVPPEPIRITEVPSAACSGLSVEKLSDSQYKFNGTATVKNGATVSAYKYIVKNSAGAVVEEIPVSSSELSNSRTYSQIVPGKYSVELIVTASSGDVTGEGCKGSFEVPTPNAPIAVCTGLDASIANSTIVSLKGSASAAGGAKLTNYTFIVRDANGKEVKRISKESDATNVTADSFELGKGDYSVELVVTSTAGQAAANPACSKKISINPTVCQYNPSLPPSHPDCQPCTEGSTLWIKDEKCHAVIINTKTSTNLTQGNTDATKVAARAGDKITYTINAQNKGTANQTVVFKENLADVLEYASIADLGGGTYDEATKTVTWPGAVVAPGQSQSRTIAIKVLDKIPTTNKGTSHAASYDCKMVNTFGNTVEIAVDCPIEKVIVEQTVAELPHTGPRENMIFAAILGSVVVYFWARSRQLGKEVRLIRRDVHAGAI